MLRVCYTHVNSAAATLVTIAIGVVDVTFVADAVLVKVEVEVFAVTIQLQMVLTSADCSPFNG